jgi:hypothetical protein
MPLEGDIYNTLSGSTALTALVSSSIYPDHRFQGDITPAVVFWRAPGGERINDIKGYGGKENPVIEVTVYTTAVDARRVVGDAVATAMTGSTRYTCLMPYPPFDDYDDETKVHERTLQFSVWY